MTVRANVGIDLGTTNSCVAIYQGGAGRVMPNPEGGRTTPSVVALLDDGRVLVGASAHRQAVMNPKGTISAVKRLVGRRFDTPEVKAMAAAAPYEIVRARNGDAWVKIGGRAFSPPEIQAFILERLRTGAEAELGATVARAVITVPAYFDEAQRQATRDAATIAGLDSVRLLNEPTAAALAFGLGKAQGETVAVVDLGGGTFDVTVMTIEDGVFEVRSTAGDMLLGGADFDRRVAGKLAEEVRAEHGVDVFAEPVAAQRLLDESEAAKKLLSTSDEALIGLPFLVMSAGGPINVARSLGRVELESLTADLVERLVAPCLQALADAKLEAAAIDHVLLVGGMTRMPAVQRRIEDMFKRRPSRGVNPDEAVALGAALETAILDGQLTDVVLIDVASHTIGVRAAGDKMVPVVKRSSAVPARARKVFSTTEDDQEHVTIDVYQGEEAVASKNRHLSRFRLGGLPKARRGEVQVEVMFAVDASGLLSVTATEMASGKKAKVDVVGGSGLGRAEVKRLAQERRGARK